MAKRMVENFRKSFLEKVEEGLFYDEIYVPERIERKLYRGARVYDKSEYHDSSQTLHLKFPENGWQEVDVKFTDVESGYGEVICLHCKQYPLFEDAEGERYCPVCE